MSDVYGWAKSVSSVSDSTNGNGGLFRERDVVSMDPTELECNWSSTSRYTCAQNEIGNAGKVEEKDDVDDACEELLWVLILILGYGTCDIFERIGICRLEDSDNVCLISNGIKDDFPGRTSRLTDDEE
ncbi:hypothetical protein EAE96_008532 [Botrytis aclada]|nr:hypothetical protein EAE96_008532 [Botrytis aclada]